MTPRLLHEWVTEQARRRPAARAVVSARGELTYWELDDLSDGVAGILQEHGCAPGSSVALLMPKSPLAIAALLGIYKAGGIYVPLDPGNPVGRLNAIIDSCGAQWVIASATTASVLDAMLKQRDTGARPSVGWLDPAPPPDALRPSFTLDDVRQTRRSPSPAGAAPDDAAHILFTSGSTGVPKGVVITHANVMHFVRWATAYFGMSPSDRVSAHSPLSFDLSFMDMFATFAAGAELHLVSPDLNVLPGRLAAFMRESALTQWFSVPSVLTYMAKFDVVRAHDFPDLKRLLWCGEVLPTPVLRYWMGRLPHVTFTNLYGPTETTIASSYYTVPVCPDDPQAHIPIGTACDGEELLVLDDTLQEVTAGQTGDLYIGGVGLAKGYWRDEERTSRAFVPHPRKPGTRLYRTGDLARLGEDGAVYFVGRCDTQIKCRGYRIELGEIESALHTLDALRESAVVAVDAGELDGATICCAYVPADGHEVTAAKLRRELNRLVPPYMVPAHWLSLDRFPKTSNGKVDRPRLRQLFQSEVMHA